eukprot:161036-Pelagomonas_calceolata.AAC.5
MESGVEKWANYVKAVRYVVWQGRCTYHMHECSDDSSVESGEERWANYVKAVQHVVPWSGEVDNLFRGSAAQGEVDNMYIEAVQHRERWAMCIHSAVYGGAGELHARP